MSAAKKGVINSGLKMAIHFNAKSKKCAEHGFGWKYKRALKVAEDAIIDYRSFKAKQIRVNNLDLQQNLKSYEACFQLLVIQFKMRLNELKIDDIDMVSMKKLVIKGYKLRDAPDLLRLVFEKLNSIFINEHEVRISRVFLMLTIDCINQKGNQPKSKQDKCAILYAEMHFLAGYSMLSSKLNQSDGKISKKHLDRELIFSDVLDTLGVADVFPTLPETVKNFEQAKILFDVMDAKINVLEELYKECSREDILGETELTLTSAELHIRFWRGLIHHDLSIFSREFEERFNLAEKSLKIWNKLLVKSFSKEDLINVVLTKPNPNATAIYINLSERNRLNYREVIHYKSTTIIKLDPKEPIVMSVIDELNTLRYDYILQMLLYLEFVEMKPVMKRPNLVVDVNREIALQYRSIILKNKKKEQKNLDRSLDHMMKGDLIPFGMSALIPDSSMINILTSVVDSDEFIKKFRLKE